jgi:hypothetical protein
MVADPFAVTPDAATVNELVEVPGAIVKEAGSMAALLLLDSVTVVPDVGAALDSPTVQLVLPPAARTLAPQVNELNVTGATRVMLAVAVEPLTPAVKVADPSDVICPAVAVNEAETEPAATVTDAGTVSLLSLLETATVIPPLGAAEVNPTEHVADPCDVSALELHCNEETVDVDGAVLAAEESWTMILPIRSVLEEKPPP